VLVEGFVVGKPDGGSGRVNRPEPHAEHGCCFNEEAITVMR